MSKTRATNWSNHRDISCGRLRIGSAALLHELALSSVSAVNLGLRLRAWFAFSLANAKCPNHRAGRAAATVVRGLAMLFRQRQSVKPVQNAALKGYFVLAGTWSFVVAAVWALLPPQGGRVASYRDYEEDTGWPVPGYLPLLVLMSSVAFWLWAVIAWMGMKFFRHA